MSENDKIIPYLSDDDLDKLIMDIEGKELVQAPAGIERNVISFIEHKKRRKTVEFSKYCLRVGFAVAAAIALVCMVPYIPAAGVKVASREAVVRERNVISRDEFLQGKSIMTREEVLKKRSGALDLEKAESYIQSQIQSLFE